MGPIAERSIHAVTILLVLALTVTALKRWQKHKAQRARPLLALETGRVSIVYFHSSSCGVCRTSQKPILERLIARMGGDKLRLVAVDVSEKTEVAREWGVTTVPSTYVIGSKGEVAYVNNGVASEPTLWRQVSSRLPIAIELPNAAEEQG
jgi:thiol-disulfide isomerase/thioredoxin